MCLSCRALLSYFIAYGLSIDNFLAIKTNRVHFANKVGAMNGQNLESFCKHWPKANLQCVSRTIINPSLLFTARCFLFSKLKVEPGDVNGSSRKALKGDSRLIGTFNSGSCLDVGAPASNLT